jgi:hypothetical protein
MTEDIIETKAFKGMKNDLKGFGFNSPLVESTNSRFLKKLNLAHQDFTHVLIWWIVLNIMVIKKVIDFLK